MKNATSHVSRFMTLLLVIGVSFTMQFCKSGYKAVEKTGEKQFENPVTYTANIAPIMEMKCTPCHYPEKGKKKLLDTYTATRNNAVDILKRVEMPATEEGFMPFKSKKEPLTAEEIQLLKDWIAQGTPE